VDELVKNASQYDYSNNFEVVVAQDGSAMLRGDVVKHCSQKLNIWY